jgi:gluconolactonase
MNYKNLFPFFILIILCFPVGSCNNNTTTTKKNENTLADTIKNNPPHISILADEGLNLIDSTAVIEVIAKGFKWSEGPVYISDGNYLVFSDVPANKIYKWKEGTGTSVFLEPSGYTGTIPKEKEPGSNGLIVDKNGRLVLCQQGNRQIARMKASLNDPRPLFETIVSNYKGKKFNSPNDLVYADNGNLYFTDPPYGLEQGIKDSTKEIPFQGVYCVKSGGKLLLVTDKISYPNGIALSPDNKILYIANSDNDNKEWIRFELNKEGLPIKDTVFYRVSAEEGKTPGNPDGMKVNGKGYIFATGPGGVWVFNPTGKVIARIYTGQLTSNCFLDQVHNMLYMTCDSLVMRVKLKPA